MRFRPFPVRVLLPLLLAVLLPAPARAQSLFLTWNDCPLAPGASHDLSWACDSNSGQAELFCCFRVDAVVDSVLGFELAVDLQHAEATLPDWWRLGQGGCRYGQLEADFDFAGDAICADFPGGRASGGVMGYYVGEPRGGANQARIRMAGAWLPGAGYVSLSPDSTYFVARLLLRHGLSTGAGACAGCGGPVCLVLNGMMLKRQPGAAGGDVELSVPGSDSSNWATWQGGSGASCAAVPARSITWGRLKGLYR